MSLPAADELFRTTGGSAVQSSSPQQQANGEVSGGASGARVPAPTGESAAAEHTVAEESGGGEVGGAPAQPGSPAAADEHSGREAPQPRATGSAKGPVPGQQGTGQPRGARTGQQPAPAKSGRQAAGGGAQRRGRSAPRRPSGRERHDEKITVYVSAEELMDLEHARLVLRGEHGLAVDRGRIVREAVAVVLADLESRGDASILVRRLRGR
ncbi:hypothetical protein [Streptomyces gobiensis]|uniref:hypothetical protein n=1 Tax=Streptomyces gobiensis TaxID=2875706 RepID=UPI001E563A4D|nr:hypothetical protein [Streptomyces gobiensis]UGY90608.1 hypothetical protein test1122_01950 [Streptomyces gobiensis]